jgi:hypothetical protein
MKSIKRETPLCIDPMFSATQSLAVTTELLIARIEEAQEKEDFSKIPDTIKLAEKAVERYYDIFKEVE